MTVMLSVLLMWLVALVAAQQTLVALELRVFDGTAEVTSETLLAVYRAGERTGPVARIAPGGRLAEVPVPPGLYDVQAVRERDGRVANIRWLERLVVMAYPDEAGHHLEVINFKSSYGALQVKPQPNTPLPEVQIFSSGTRDRPAAARVGGVLYALFIVPAGRYDLLVRSQDRSGWHESIEVPLDRTRLWVVPPGGR